MGIGGKLAEADLHWTKSEGKKAIPLCPFIAGYMARHPEWKEILMEGDSIGLGRLT